jgi:sulfonate transport system substrate-binding protein
MRMRTIWMGAWLAVAVAAQAAGPAREIRLALVGNPYNKRVASGIIGYAQEHHLFEEEFAKDGIAVRWEFYKGTGPAINEALANNKADIASYGDLPGILGKAAGIDTRLIVPGPVSQNIYIGVQPGAAFASVADLKGKRVGYNKGTYLHLSFVRLIQSLGLKEKDFKVFNLNVPDGNAALLAGHIDAYVGTSTLVELNAKHAIRILYATDGVDPEKRRLQGFSTVVATGRFLRENPDLAARWVKVYVSAASKALREEYREDWIRLAAKPGYPESNIRYDLGQSNLAQQNAPVFDGRYLEKLRAGIQASLQAGLIRGNIDVSQWIEPAYLDKALKEAGGGLPWTAAPNAAGASGNSAAPAGKKIAHAQQEPGSHE